MRRVSSLRGVAILAALLAAPLTAGADDRTQLDACKALVDRAAQSQRADAKPDEAELQRCRQIIHEWAMRDARMTVDENGRPLR